MDWLQYPELSEQLFRRTLSNGLTVMVLPRPGFTKKLAYFVTDFGSIHRQFTLDGAPFEAPEGIAHFLEHKLFDMPDRDVTEEFAAMGASPNAFTSYDLTAYYFACTQHFEECLKLLLEFVSTPYFTPESVAKEQGIIAQEIDMVADTPDTRIFELLMQNMYRNHPLRETILGTRETIGQITPEVLHACHQAFYRPDNMVLCVVGDVDPETVCAIAEAQLPAASCPPAQRQRTWQEDMTCPGEDLQITMEVAMPMFQLGFKCEPAPWGETSVQQEIIGDLAAEALFGESSGLYMELYQQGLIDSSFSGGFETIDGAALLNVSGDSDQPEAVRDAILTQAQVLLETGIPETDFLRMKRSALGRRIRGLDSFDSVCFRLCACHLSGVDYFRFPEFYRQASVADVLEFIRQTVVPQRMRMCVIYPKEET